MEAAAADATAGSEVVVAPSQMLSPTSPGPSEQFEEGVMHELASQERCRLPRRLGMEQLRGDSMRGPGPRAVQGLSMSSQRSYIFRGENDDLAVRALTMSLTVRRLPWRSHSASQSPPGSAPLASGADASGALGPTPGGPIEGHGRGGLPRGASGGRESRA